MESRKPNLFNHATSELSNDAILCWMFEWGNHKDENEQLYLLSKKFMKLFLDNYDDRFEISKLEIKKQYKFDWHNDDDGKVDKKYIDILLLLETNRNKKFAIVIEDKVDSKENNNQLKYYKELPDIDEKLKGYEPYFVYIKIGEDSDLESVREKGFKVVDRKQIIEIIESVGIQENQILKDYHDFLVEIQKEVDLFKQSEKLGEWRWRSWQGFYSNLQNEKQIKDNCWGYVPNRTGGFLGFWWMFKDVKVALENLGEHEAKIYLQNEIRENKDEGDTDLYKARVTFKVEVENEAVRSEVRNYVWNKLKNLDNSNVENGFKFDKTRFSKGRSMTIAEISDLSSREGLMEAINDAEKHLELTIKCWFKLIDHEDIRPL